LFRQSVFGRLAGYEDVNDAERLHHDPAIRCIVAQGCAASPSQMGCFETQWLAAPENVPHVLATRLIGLPAVPGSTTC
jgi:DDE family transposase